MIKVYTAQSSIDAYLIKGLLESEGIPAVVRGAALQGGIGELPAMGLITVNVARHLAAEAAAVIKAYEQSDPLDENDGEDQWQAE